MKNRSVDHNVTLEASIRLQLPCALTGKMIHDSDYTIWFPYFITDKEDPFWRYNEWPMLREAFDEWEHKDAFLARWNDSMRTHLVPRTCVLVSQPDYLIWLAESPPAIVLNFLVHGFTINIPRKEWRRFKGFLLEPRQRFKTLRLSNKWQVSTRMEGDRIRIAWEPYPTIKGGRRDRVLLNQSEWESLKEVVSDVDQLLSPMKR